MALLLDRGADGGDLERRRPAATADQPRAEAACVRGELREVLRGRVRVDDSAAREAGEADVGEHRERGTARAHRLERREGGVEAGAVIGSDRGELERAQALGGLARGHSGERLRAFVEGEGRDDRER